MVAVFLDNVKFEVDAASTLKDRTEVKKKILRS